MTTLSYERTRAWKTSLASRPDDLDEAPRERLRVGFRRMRDKAATLAGEIARDLPDYTVHDVTHLDALWELVDLIGGDDLVLNPCETFVLGGALLTHDLGMTAAAYPGGRDELRAQERWRDTIARLMRREGLEHRPGQDPPEDVTVRADREVLRLLHADKAREIPKQRWTDRQGNDVRFMEDDELRERFGPLIGELASSHWWSTTKLRDAFDKSIGAPTWCPPDWTVDPLRLACLLRAADVAHVDDRRAPAFLRMLRRPSGISDHHWLFQGRMQRAIRRGEQLVFGSTVPFTAEEAPAWWVGVEALRSIDGELRAIDALLQAASRSRLAARRVAAVDDLHALQSHIMVQGWRPVDTRVRVSDIPGLIERLGGRKLYGNDGDAPLRELIQNAADAVRARRAFENRPPEWGQICVARGRDDHGPWIEVRDDGLGMSEAVLVGPLLDFGVSYWSSELSSEEFPGLLASGFRSVGEFGIGFFSVFMWGSKVKVTTRSCRAADTLVLEFERGVSCPPLLRGAERHEHLVDGGTTVRVWLPGQEEFKKPYGPSDLSARCQWLCPTLDVDVYVQEPDMARPERTIVARDWLTLDPASFLLRVAGWRREHVADVLINHAASDDDFEIERVTSLMDPIVDPISKEIMGRACIKPPWAQSTAQALVTRGIRLGSRIEGCPVLGVVEGVPTKAARDEGIVSVPPEAMQAWYARQEAKIAATFAGFGRFELAGVLAEVMLAPVTKLPVVWGSRGFTLRELANHQSLPPVIILAFDGAFDDINETSREGRRAKPLEDPPTGLFLLCGHWRLDVDCAEQNNPTLVGILCSIADAWGVSVGEMLVRSRFTKISKGEREPAIPQDAVWGEWVHVLVRPDCPKEAVVATLEGFYEFAKKNPSNARQVGARLYALGGAIGDAQKKVFADRQRQRRGQPNGDGSTS